MTEIDWSVAIAVVLAVTVLPAFCASRCIFEATRGVWSWLSTAPFLVFLLLLEFINEYVFMALVIQNIAFGLLIHALSWAKSTCGMSGSRVRLIGQIVELVGLVVGLAAVALAVAGPESQRMNFELIGLPFSALFVVLAFVLRGTRKSP